MHYKRIYKYCLFRYFFTSIIIMMFTTVSLTFIQMEAVKIFSILINSLFINTDTFILTNYLSLLPIVLLFFVLPIISLYASIKINKNKILLEVKMNQEILFSNPNCKVWRCPDSFLVNYRELLNSATDLWNGFWISFSSSIIIITFWIIFFLEKTIISVSIAAIFILINLTLQLIGNRFFMKYYSDKIHATGNVKKIETKGLDSYLEIKNSTTEPFLFECIDKEYENFFQHHAKIYQFGQNFEIIEKLIATIFIILTFFVMYQYTSNLSNHISTIITLAGTLPIILNQINRLGESYSLILRFKETSAMLLELIELSPTNSVSFENSSIISTKKNIIQIDQLSFSYSNESEHILTNISMQVSDGERILIIGENGSGKTTFIKLICGLLRPLEGKVKIDGIDIHNMPLEWMADKISCCFQNDYLFSFSPLKNVQIIENSDLIQSNSFKENMRLSQNNDIGFNGSKLSGGERQWIILMRTLASKANILILDEPENHLDSSRVNELKILLSTDPRTIIVISHKSSCLINFDRVINFGIS